MNHISLVIYVPPWKRHSDICFPTQEKHILSDMCSPPWKRHIPSYMCSPTNETHIPSDMCSPTQETHIPSNMCSTIQETHITSDTYSSTQETHIPSDMCSLRGTRKHISLVTCVPPPNKKGLTMPRFLCLAGTWKWYMRKNGACKEATISHISLTCPVLSWANTPH